MLDDILEKVQNGTLSINEAKERLATFENLGFAKIDHHRKNVRVSLRSFLVKERRQNKSL
ncbi:NCAIR mutase (PurE)-related protein [Neobacillus cucumis]|nr:NCAIR mutase (PurE)-related protein [Neobacillus cucumis]